MLPAGLGPDSSTERPRRPSRIRPIVILGAVVIAAAVLFRVSPWAREYRMKRASLGALQAWAARSPGDPLLQYYLGTQYHNAEREPEALTAFQKAVSLDPKMPRAYVGLAAVDLRLGQNRDAAEAARQAVALDRHSVDGQYLLAVAVYTQSKTQALLEFQKLNKLAPGRADGWHWTGQCQKELTDFAGALAPFQKAVDLEPNNGLYHRDLGGVLMDLGRFDTARQELEKALKYAPEDAEANYLLARNLATTANSDADLKKAASLMAHAVDLLDKSDRQNVAAVMVEQSQVLRQLKRHAEEYDVLRRARAIDPKNTRILHYMGLAARAIGKNADADRWLSEYSRLNRQETDLSNLEQRVKQDPKNAPLRLRLARLYLQAENYPFAVNQYEMFLSMQPGNAQAKQERQALLERLKKMQEKQALKATPGGPDSVSR